MTPAITVAVLAAALLHATWNALAHRMADKLVAFAWIGLGSLPLAAALAVYAPAPAVRCWPLLALSAALEVGYAVLLMRSYRLGEFSQVYPLARGTAPLAVALLAAVLVAERLTLAQLAGMLLVCAGLAALMCRAVDIHAPAVVAAVGTGLTIAAYTVVDGIGVRLSGSPLGYIAWLMLLHRPVMPLVALAHRRRDLPAQLRAAWRPGLLAGTLSVPAYGLVLWAQTRGALAPIAALRESSIIAGAVIGAVVFGEPYGRARVTATVLVAAGIVILSGAPAGNNGAP